MCTSGCGFTIRGLLDRLLSSRMGVGEPEDPPTKAVLGRAPRELRYPGGRTLIDGVFALPGWRGW